MEREPREQEPEQPDWSGCWMRPARCLAVIAGYAVAGWWCFRFAGSLSPWIPFWLPAGIGVVVLMVWGAGYWPAVFLGAALSFWIEFQDTLRGGTLAWVVGMGAVAQTGGNLLAAVLIHRRVHWPNDLSEGRRAVGFYLAGGVAGPLVSALIWAAGWLGTGAFPPGALFYTLVVWFLAGAIGFCLVAPMILALAKPMTDLWEGRKVRFGVPLAATFVFAIALLAYVCGSVGRHMQADFRELTGRMASRMGKEFNEISEALESVRSFWDGSVEVDRNEFAIVSRRYLERHPGLLFLGWAPVIDREQSGNLTQWIRSRAALDPDPENQRRMAGFSLHGARESGTAGGPHVAPVVYVEPAEKDRKWLGHDLAASEECRRAIEQTRALGVPVATSPAVFEEQGIREVLGFLWLERSGKPDPAGETWLTDQSGIALAVIDAESIVARVLKEFAAAPVGVVIADVTAIDSEDEENRGLAPAPILVGHDPESHPGISMGIGRVSHLISFANRHWQLEFHPAADLIPSMLSWEVPAVQTGVLLVSSLLGVLLLVTTGYTVRMEREVRERTRRLAETQEDLRRSNAELEQFAYIASHDLREPLRMVTSFVQLLQRRYGEKLGKDADEYIRYAVEGAERMRELIQGLLEISRVGTRGHPLTEIDAGDALKNALDNLRVVIEESGARIESESLPVVFADRMQLTRLFQNLIENAIKFKLGGNPRIEISAVRDGGYWQFSVKDNGPGIPEEHRVRIFQVFQRLGPRQGGVEGTGIGLAVCRRIVERHGGEISVHGREGGGSEFRFTLPAEGKQNAEAETRNAENPDLPAEGKPIRENGGFWFKGRH